MQHTKKVIVDIEIGNMKISSASEKAEAFNCHFANIGHDLPRDIPSADIFPESYLISTNATFSFKSCSSNGVRKLLEKLETKKAARLDNLPSKMLKIAAGVLALSLAFLFNQSISSGIVPTEWKQQGRGSQIVRGQTSPSTTGSFFPARGLIILVTRRPELSAILN